MKKKLGARERGLDRRTQTGGRGEGGGLEVRGAVRWRGERVPSSNCQSINHEKEPQVKPDSRTLTRQMKF